MNLFYFCTFIPAFCKAFGRATAFELAFGNDCGLDIC